MILLCFLMFFFIHTSFSKVCFICDVSYTSFRSIIDKIELTEPLFEGEIELDEMYFRSGLKGSSYSEEIKESGREPRSRGLKRHKRGRGSYKEDLIPILSIINREGSFLLIPISTASEKDIKKEIEKYCDMLFSQFYTDEWRSYNFLENREYVTHSNHEYCRDGVHVNTAEGNHNLFRIFMSVHMGVNKKKLEQYIKYFKIMRKAMRIKNDEELVKYYISLLVQKRN